MQGQRSVRVWDAPSERIAELVRRGVQRVLDDSAAVIAELDASAIEANSRLLEIEPGLLDSIRAATRSNFAHWATGLLRDPGSPVEPNLGPENVEFARDVVRHGLDETIMDGFRSGQNVGIQLWHRFVFELTSDPDEIQELLRVVSRSLFAYVDDTLQGLHELIDRERAELRDPARAGRLEVIQLIREGANISEKRASDQLRYELARHHVAGVVWSDHDADPVDVESAARAVAMEAGSQSPLIVPVSSSAMWLWISSRTELDMSAIRVPGEETGARRGAPSDAVRFAFGRSGHGLAGFRASHLEAMDAQRLARRLGTLARVTFYEEIEVVALAARDAQAASDFMRRTLGGLVDAPAETRETLRIYLREQCSITRTAEALPAHRNTVLARLDRAKGLLPGGLDGHVLQVALALEIHRYADPGRP